jgi:Fuc2NAc and GlcNAc transferase
MTAAVHAAATIFAGSLAAGWALTFVVRLYARRRGVLDRPGERSSHAVPTPRGGGLAIVATLLGAAAIVVWLRPAGALVVAAVVLPTLVVAMLGLVDDHRGLSANFRLRVQFFCAAASVVALWATLGPRPLPGGWFALALVLCVPAIAWCTNLYNFMDGIDGIAASQGVFVALTAAWLLQGRGMDGIAWLLVACGGACAGFLAWNWRPASIFMGDVGSGALGFFFGAVALATWVGGVLTPWVWILLLGVFIADATTTLAVRWHRGDRLAEAHRSHAYQRLSRRLGDHGKVVRWVVAVNLLWLMPLATLATVRPNWGGGLAVTGIGALVYAALRLGAGRPDHMA